MQINVRRDAAARGSSSSLVATHSEDAAWCLQDDVLGGLKVGIDVEFVKTVVGDL